MKKYFTYSIITILCIILADIGVGKILEYLSLHQKNNLIFELRYKLNQAKPVLLILGSSRAYHHYNTTIIENKSGLKTMNYGMDGTDVFIEYLFLSHLLNKPNKLKTVIIDIKPQELENPVAYSYITRLYPLTAEVKEIKENCNSFTKYERFKLLSQTYRYNDYLILLLNGCRGSKSDTLSITGFKAIPATKNTSLKKIGLVKKRINPEAVKYLQKIAALCHEKNVQLIMSMSPAYMDHVQEMTTYDALQQFSIQHSIPFLYYGDWKETANPIYYSDFAHLNEHGANIFSSFFAEDIAKLLKK